MCLSAGLQGHGLRTGFPQISIEARSGVGTADAPEGTGRKPRALWIPSPAHSAATRRLAGEPQAPLPAILRRRPDPHPEPEVAPCLKEPALPDIAVMIQNLRIEV